jgi:LacI family transcriptional regulator
MVTDAGQVERAAPTIYDVARMAGVSIASVSRVLNGTGNPRPETRDRVRHAVAELGFVPDGAARALTGALKQTVGAVYRRVPHDADGGPSAEDENLQFADMLNRGIEVAARRSGVSVLVSSVDAGDRDAGSRVRALARKCDGLIVHDLVLEPGKLDHLARQSPVVNLAGVTTPSTVGVRCDNAAGIRALVAHLAGDHGYRTLGYLAGFADSPDNLARRDVAVAAARAAGAELATGPDWQAGYFSHDGERAIDKLLARGAPLPRAILCANDLAALGALRALARHGIDVPGDVAVTGFDDIPLAHVVRPQLTTVRQPIQELGATAFELLQSLIAAGQAARREVVLPVQLIRRESCGCPAVP